MVIQFEKEIKQLRREIPIGIHEARRLLRVNKGNVTQAKSEFIADEVKKISAETSMDIETVKGIFHESEFNRQVARTRVRQLKYDQNFDKSRLKGIEDIDFKAIDEWIYWCETESFRSGVFMNGYKDFYQLCKNHLLLEDVPLPQSIRTSSQSKPIYSEELKRIETYYEENETRIMEEFHNFIRNFSKYMPQQASAQLKDCHYL
jgi:hypothetical protein